METGASQLFVGKVWFLASLIRNEKSNALRMQPFYVPKNAVQSTRNVFGKIKNSNGALSSVLTNLYSAHVAHERIAKQHLAMGNFQFGSHFAPEGLLPLPTTQVFQPRV